MNIEIKSEGATSVAVIAGDIDGKNAAQAQSELLPIIETSGKLLMDMSNVTFLSSAGLRMLLLLYRQATSKNGKVALIGLSEEIKDTMSMTGFLNFFIIADSMEEGIKALG